MKKFISHLLVLCIIISTLVMLPIGAATPTDSYTFDGDHWFFADTTLADAPRTVEAWIYVDPQYGTQTKTIISNYNGFGGYAYWHLAVKYENSVLYPYFEWNELYNNSTSNRKFNFRNAVITPGEWTHIAIVIDAPNSYVSCYKNGVHIQNNSASIQLNDIAKNVTELPLVVGNDNRPSAQGTGDDRAFHGKIASISLFNDIRNADEIASDYSDGADYNDENALAHWELGADSSFVKSKADKEINLSLSQYWLSEGEMDEIRGDDFDPAYSFAIVGDIQYITERDVVNGTDYTKQIHQWIANSIDSKNIKLMLGMGDITNRNTAEEWEVAYDAISLLNGKLPYTVIQGNHDIYSGTTASTDRIPNKTMLGYNGFDQYFAKDTASATDYIDQFKGSDAGLYRSGSVANSWYSFKAGSTDWLIISLEFAPNDDILEWANQVVSSHPDHKVIMTTHGYLHMDGTPISNEDSGSLIGDTKNNGEEMWTKFASLHENIVMVLSGHMESNLIRINQAKGVNGNTVSQFLIDQQTVDSKYMDNGEKPLGLVAMFYFDKDGRNVSVEWYSTLHDKYFQTENQISFDMEAECEEQSFTWNGLSIAPKGSGTKNDPYLVENGGNLLWMANQISDNTATSAKFEGKYFKQICDIDLGGCVTKSIGYYHTSEGGSVKMAAFGGNYDGCGYSIRNGRISSFNISHGQNINWADGLFGVIYGATIKNVVLENIEIWSRGVTGGIVGRALAPLDASADESFNVISGCEIKNDCRIYAIHCNGQSVSKDVAYGNKYHAGAVGAICGMAYATTIEGCTSAVEFSVNGDHSLAGGIVAVAGYNTVIDACAFTGGITLTDNTSKVASSFGGIVGTAVNNESETMYVKDDTFGYLKISNCYNKGYFRYTGSESLQQETHWGGIIGNASHLYDVDPSEHIFTIENCYNLYEKKSNAKESGAWIGGLVGHALVEESNYDSTLWISNSASVKIDAVGGKDMSTNEYRTDNSINVYDQYAISIVESSVSTKSANEMANAVKGIDDLIAALQDPDTDSGSNGNGEGDDNDSSNNDNNSNNNSVSSGNVSKPTDPPASPETDAPKKKGCGSVIGGSAIILSTVIIIGSGLSIITRKDL